MVLNSDSESVLLKGLRRFARQIRLEHGLIAEKDAQQRRAEDGDGLPHEEEAEHAEAGKTTAMEEDNSDDISRSSGSEDEGQEGETANVGHAEGIGGDDGYAEALAEAAGKGEPPGLLGEYLRGSPQLNDLLRLWDLDERKVRASRLRGTA